MSAPHGINFKVHCDVTSHVLVHRYQKFWKVLTTKPHNISSQKKSSSSKMSFKRKTNWICFGLNFNVYLSLLLHFLLVCLQQWLLLPLARVLFYKTFHLLVSCCYRSQFQFIISITFVSLEMNDPFDKIDVITSLQPLFHSWNRNVSFFVIHIRCSPFCILVYQVAFSIEITKFVLPFLPLIWLPQK